MCVILYDLSTGVCCSQNADVIKSHPHILANISDHLFGVMEGFINTRYSMHSMMYSTKTEYSTQIWLSISHLSKGPHAIEKTLAASKETASLLLTLVNSTSSLFVCTNTISFM